jgi:regulator of sigma E protease
MLTFFHGLIAWAPIGIPAFIFVIAIVIFVHELGHFLVARACGVGIKTFSIGFGGEIFGWTDKKGTRWKVCWLPLGGYVMFEGDANVASVPDAEAVAKMTAKEQARALPLKPLWQRALVAAAGPVANFVLAFVMFAFLLAAFGARAPSTFVGGVQAKSPAAEAGIKPGDKITAVNGQPVRFFPDLVNAVQTAKQETLVLTIQRSSESHDLLVTPREIEIKDIFGGKQKARALGILRDDVNPQNAVWFRVPLIEVPQIAAYQCWAIAEGSLTYLWRIVSHRADPSQVGGVIGMAQMAKSAASHGFYDLIYLVAFISVSIGLINLFPIPLLDGGHLLYYACEGVLGRPLTERTQDVGFRLGLALVMGLMIFATWNDLVR